MNKFIGHLALLITALTVTQTVARGQDFFRDLGTSRSSGGIGPVTPSDYSYQDGSPSGLRDLKPGYDPSIPTNEDETEKYNFAIGSFRFSIAAGVGVEWNDNINLSQNNRESDFVFRPVLNIDSTWHISDLNTLRFNIGLSYAKYLDHSEFDTDGVLISPTSELSFAFFVGAVKFTLRDRVGYQEDTYDVPELSNVAKYRRWENQAGIDMDWQINQAITLSAGYDHYNLWALDDEFKIENRAIDTIFIKPGVQLNPALKVGVNASYSFIDFEDDARSDGHGLLAGPFIEWQISDYTNLYLEGGYQELKFDNASNYNDAAITQLGLSSADAAAVRGILADDEDSGNYYIKFEINNRPTDYFRHRLQFSKTAELGFSSNFYTIYNVEYDADWKITEHMEIGPTVFYEHYTTSGDLGEKANRIGAAIGMRYHFSNSLTLGLDYRYLYKDSNLDGFDYYQNLILLSLYYKF